MSVEILAPAGSKESFFAAVNAGADAIYLGLSEFSARSAAENFSVAELDKYLRYAHFFGIKVYIAVNTLIKESELNKFFSIVKQAYRSGADAFIVQDIFIGKFLKERIPDICLHLSTQAGVCNEYGAVLAKECGFSRVILARETAVDDIKKIASIIETEVFVQGALCTSFSGHCYMSSFAGGNSGNRGNCKQPCRKKYTYSGNMKKLSGYCLSLSDLCLKDEVNELQKLGVKSFKIEGRMRSPEYVFSAVRVYRDNLKNIKSEYLPSMRTAFNRGDYTKGYFTPNMSNIISSKIQGNIGEFVGKIYKVQNGVALVKTPEKYSFGDGFKIIDEDGEKCGASFLSSAGGILKLSCGPETRVGDDVRITKDQSFYENVVSMRRKERIEIDISFNAEKKAVALIKLRDFSLTVESDDTFSKADKHALSEGEVSDCFNKTDDYPFEVVLSVDTGGVFAPKSILNAFRRKCYASFFSAATERSRVDVELDFTTKPRISSDIKESKNAVIIRDFSNLDSENIDALIYRPRDYSDTEEAKKFLCATNNCEKYLYLPPFASGKDLELFERCSEGFDGIYAEGYYGIVFARKHGLKLFCGTGFNIFNSIDIDLLSDMNGEVRFAYSKELSASEISALPNNGYALEFGSVQVMDLIYCPFSRDCAHCNRRDIYFLTDDGGREFKVRRYLASGCRFEVYNPFTLISPKRRDGNRLFDFTLVDLKSIGPAVKGDTDTIKLALNGYTYGNLPRGIL